MYPFIKFFSVEIPSYALCMLSGFTLVIILSILRSKKKYTPIRWDDMLAIAVIVLGMALFCGYVLYIFVTYPVFEYLSQGYYTFLLNGGIVFYGALFGGIAGAFAGIKLFRISVESFEASVVPFIPLGHAIGRIGCTLAGCCYGMEYYGPGAIYYPENNPLYTFDPTVGHFPVQLLEASLDVAIMVILLVFLRKQRRKYDATFLYLALYSAMRFCTEMLRGDEIRGVYEFNISTSQWISIGIIVLCIARILILKYVLPKIKKSVD